MWSGSFEVLPHWNHMGLPENAKNRKASTFFSALEDTIMKERFSRGTASFEL